MRIRKSSVEPGGRSEMQADLARKELGNLGKGWQIQRNTVSKNHQ